MKTGDSAGAEAEFREAIRLRPHYAEAHHNLAHLLSAHAGSGPVEEARYHFEEALRINPDQPETRYDYAVMLARANLAADAQRQLQTVLRSDPGHLRALDLLGELFEAKGQRADAIEQFRRALRLEPEFAPANLDLGRALIRSGETAAARPFLTKAADSPDPEIRAESRKLLEAIQ